MSDLPDLLQASQDAVVAKLKASPAAALADIRQAVKPGMQPPLIMVGDLDSKPLGEKGGDCKLITFDVDCVYRGDLARRGLLAMMSAVFNALSDESLDDLDGVSFSSPTWLSEETGVTSDGVTFASRSQFEVIAEPA